MTSQSKSSRLRRQLEPTPRLSLEPEDAAAALGVSLAHFKRHIQPNLRVVYSGLSESAQMAARSQVGHVRLRLQEIERMIHDHAPVQRAQALAFADEFDAGADQLKRAAERMRETQS